MTGIGGTIASRLPKKRSFGARELTQSKEDVSGDHLAEENQHLHRFGVNTTYWSVGNDKYEVTV
jgi:hypothetical protein